MTESGKHRKGAGGWLGSFTRFRRDQINVAGTQPDSPTTAQRRKVWYGKECVYCDAPAEAADHVWPRARGGWDVIDNLAPTCTSCNSSKGDKLLTEWRGDRVAHAIKKSTVVLHSLLREIKEGHPPPPNVLPGWKPLPPLPVPTLAESRAAWLASQSRTDQVDTKQAQLEPLAPIQAAVEPAQPEHQEEAVMYAEMTLNNNALPAAAITNWLCLSEDTLSRLSGYGKAPLQWTTYGISRWITEGWRRRVDEGRWQVSLAAPGMSLWERRSWTSLTPWYYTQYLREEWSGVLVLTGTLGLGVARYMPAVHGRHAAVEQVAEQVQTTAVVNLPLSQAVRDPARPEVPWDLIEDHWPKQDAENFATAWNGILNLNQVVVNEPPKQLPTAEQVQREFLVATGNRVLDDLGLTTDRLVGHYTTVDRLRLYLMEAGEAITTTKLAIASLAVLANVAPPEFIPGDPAVVDKDDYKFAIRDLNRQLTTTLHRIGDEIAAGEPGIHANTPGAHHITCVATFGGLPNVDAKLRKVMAAKPGEKVEGLPDLMFPVRTADGIATSCERG